MPNQPAQDTVTISFTLPRALNEAIEGESRNTLSNKSDIIRRALMNSLSPAERQQVLDSNSSKPSPVSMAARKIRKRNKPAAE